MKRSLRDRRCTYLVLLRQSIDDLPGFAAYLSSVAVRDFDVIVVDHSDSFDANRQVLRWVSRHVAVRPQHRAPSGAIDPVRAAIDVAACEKVIVADEHVRYSDNALDEMCMLLDLHEVVEPQDYFDPLPWWGGIEAGRMLVHRGIDPLPDHGATFGFRRSAVRGLRGIDGWVASTDHARKLASQGAEVFSGIGLFVRRIPPMLGDWLRQRPLQADSDFVLPAKTIFFLSLIPVALVLMVLGGYVLAGTYAGTIAFASIALAMRGRIGASSVFPWRACFFAPLWVLERSVSVYWALFRKVSATSPEPRVPVLDRSRGERVASGE